MTDLARIDGEFVNGSLQTDVEAGIFVSLRIDSFISRDTKTGDCELVVYIQEDVISTYCYGTYADAESDRELLIQTFTK